MRTSDRYAWALAEKVTEGGDVRFKEERRSPSCPRNPGAYRNRTVNNAHTIVLLKFTAQVAPGQCRLLGVTRVKGSMIGRDGDSQRLLE